MHKKYDFSIKLKFLEMIAKIAENLKILIMAKYAKNTFVIYLET
jgi:hypothetical protein